MNNLKRFLLTTLLSCSNTVGRYGPREKLLSSRHPLSYSPTFPFGLASIGNFLTESGLSVQYLVMRSDLAVKGLITGDVDYMQSASSVLARGGGRRAAGHDSRSVQSHFFRSRRTAGIRLLNDLRGKQMGISRYGAPTDYAVRFAFKANDIDPDKEVKLLAVGAGTDAARISALEGGVVLQARASGAVQFGRPTNSAPHNSAVGRLFGDAVRRIGN